MQDGNSSGSGADDFIPAPGGSADNGSVAPTTTGTLDNGSDTRPAAAPLAIGQTALILSVVAFLVLAGLLLIVKTSIRRSLIGGRATIDTADAAGWSWYVSLLLFGGLVIAGIAGGLFSSTIYIALTAAVLIIGSLVSFNMIARARRSA